MKRIYFICLLFACCFKLHAQSSFDYKIIEELNIENDYRRFDGASRFFSNGNNFFIIGAPVFMLSEGFFKGDKKMINAGKDAFISLGVSTIITFGLKDVVRRERPFVKWSNVVKLSSGGGYSFPSGHTSSAFSVATSISMSYPKWYVITPCYLWAGMVGMSRITLGVHYPSDVIAGAIVGAGSAFLTKKANHWVHKEKKKTVDKVVVL